METSKKQYLKQSNGSQKGTRLSVGRTVLSTAFGKKLEDRLALVRGAVTPLQSHEQWKKKRHKKENPEHKRKLCGKVCDRDGEVGGGNTERRCRPSCGISFPCTCEGNYLLYLSRFNKELLDPLHSEV